METPDPIFKYRSLVFHDILHVPLMRYQLQSITWSAQRSLGDTLQFFAQPFIWRVY